MAEPVDLVLFDLGGVLIEVGGVGAMRELTGMDSDEELWRRWLTCRWVRRFESGRCSETEFAAGLIADWKLDLSAAAFLDAFRDWPTGPLPGAEELVIQTRASVTTGCFSNTNTLHWHGQVAAWPLAGLFDRRFLSFELGLLKPDVAAFARVADLLELPAGRILFLDDNALNVEGAAAAGFQAARVAGVGEARQRLVEAAVLVLQSRLIVAIPSISLTYRLAGRDHKGHDELRSCSRQPSWRLVVRAGFRCLRPPSTWPAWIRICARTSHGPR